MILAEDLEKVEKRAKFKGSLATSPQELHKALCREAEVDSVACENFINHHVKNMSNLTPLSNDMKSLIAVAMRHTFITGIVAGRRDQDHLAGI